MTARQLPRVTPVKGKYGLALLEPLEPPEALDWRDFALCREVDSELFFPEKGEPNTPAKRICRACPVRSECLEDALRFKPEYGIWGGLSTKQRQKLGGKAVAA